MTSWRGLSELKYDLKKIDKAIRDINTKVAAMAEDDSRASRFCKNDKEDEEYYCLHRGCMVKRNPSKKHLHQQKVVADKALYTELSFKQAELKKQQEEILAKLAVEKIFNM